MKKKLFLLIALFAFILSSCGDQSDVSQGVVSESEMSVASESSDNSSQLSDSEDESDPADETTESDAEEITDQSEDDKPMFASEEDKAAFELLGDYYDSATYSTRYVGLHITGESWELSGDYELFRKYFFGSWEKDEPQSWETPLVIDDSESAFIAKNCMSFFLLEFFKGSGDVLAFQVGSAGGGTLFLLDRNNPDTLYEAEGTPGESPNGILSGEDGFPNVWTLHKNDTDPNEPENNYLSVYRLREMAQKYGIDYSMIVDVEWKKDILYHDSKYCFYPMYLVSEADDRIEILTQAGDPYSYAVDIRIILQNIDGEWVRTVESDDAATQQ